MLLKIAVFFAMIIRDKDGKPSAGRFIAVLFGMVFCFVWAYVSIKTGSLANIKDITQLVIAIGGLISYFGTKAVEIAKIAAQARAS